MQIKNMLKKASKKSVTSSMNNKYKCPDCGSTDFTSDFVRPSKNVTIIVNKCKKCGRTWNNKLESSSSDGRMQ